MNANDRQRIRKEILQLMTPPVSFRVKKPEILFHVFYVITGLCMLFTGIQIGELSTKQRFISYEEPGNSLIQPVSQPIYYINGKPVTTDWRIPELPEIEIIYVES